MFEQTEAKWIPWKKFIWSVLTEHQPGTQYSSRICSKLWRYEENTKHSFSPQEAYNLTGETKLILIMKYEYDRICPRYPKPNLMSLKHTLGLLSSIDRLTTLNDVRVQMRTFQCPVKSHFPKSLSPFKKATWMWMKLDNRQWVVPLLKTYIKRSRSRM